MTRSSARLLNINVNSLTNDTKKSKIGRDDSKKVNEQIKLSAKPEGQTTLSCNAMNSKAGNAEKKRQLYTRALGFNAEEQSSRKTRATKKTSAAPEVIGVTNSAQLLHTNASNSSKGAIENKRNENKNKNVFEYKETVQELSEPSASLSTTNVFNHLPHNNIVAKIEFRLNEVIWCKIRGWPTWPCRIRAFVKNMAIVVWFNDYRTTKVYRTQLQKFLINFDKHAKNFDSNIALKTAAREALMDYYSE